MFSLKLKKWEDRPICGGQGHSPYKRKMIETGAPACTGEMSASCYFSRR